MLFSRSSSGHITKITHLRFASIENSYLWTYLVHSGITVSGNFPKRSCIRKSIRVWFPTFLHIALLLSLIQLILGYMSGMWNINVIVAAASGNILSVVLWHMMYHKRNHLHEFLVKVQEQSYLHFYSNTKDIEAVLINWTLLLNTTIPFAFALLCIFSASMEANDEFWSFGLKLGDLSILNKILIFAAITSYNSIKIIFPGLLTCIYCALCNRLSKLLNFYHQKLLNNAHGLLESPAKILVKQYFEILSSVELLQNIFSEPLFVLILRNFLHMFSTLAYFMPFLKNQFTTIIIGEMTMMTLTTCLPTMAIMIFAEKTTNSIRNVKQAFRRYKEKIVFEQEGANEEILQLAIDREYIQLSACDTIVFRRRFILSMFGALLTYTLIIFQITV